MDEEFLTIAEAATRLGVTIPRLRRLLARPQFAPYCKTVARQTRTGIRTATVIPVSVLSSIQIDATQPVEREHKQEREQERLPASPDELIVAFERIIAEKDARIKDLTEALEHERERSRRHAEAHARAQALLSLSAPQ